MKLALASDLYVDSYSDDQQIDWHVVRRWTGVDILVIGGNISGSPARTKREVLAAREAFDCVIFVEGDPEHQTGLQNPEDLETLRQFAALNDGVHYLDGGGRSTGRAHLGVWRRGLARAPGGAPGAADEGGGGGSGDP